MSFKLGKLDPVRLYGIGSLREYAVGRVPKVPASVNPAYTGAWGMLCNDRLGCCAIAGPGHIEMNIGAIAPTAPTLVPDDALTESTYFGLTGGPDSGLTLASVVTAWQSPTGLFSPEDQILGGAQLNFRNHVELEESIAFTGSVDLGIACPASAQEQAQQQMETGQPVPWTYEPGSQIEGGHCVVGVGYESGGIWIVSWGALFLATWQFLSHYLDEAWSILPKQFQEAGHGPLNIDYATLQSDWAEINGRAA